MIELLLDLVRDQTKAVGKIDDRLGRTLFRPASDPTLLSEDEIELVQAAVQDPSVFQSGHAGRKKTHE